MGKVGKEFEELVQIISRLREPDGCDWDIAQTNQSLIPFMIEEIYELIESIDDENWETVKEELGDVLFSIVNLARHLRLDPELALSKSNKKFIARFTAIERNLAEKNKLISDCAEIELEELWRAQK